MDAGDERGAERAGLVVTRRRTVTEARSRTTRTGGPPVLEMRNRRDQKQVLDVVLSGTVTHILGKLIGEAQIIIRFFR